MPWYYDDGTPVPESDLPSELRASAAPPQGAAQPVPAAQAPEGQAPFWRSATDVAGTFLGGPFYSPRTPAGKRLAGAREAAATVGSGMAAWPLGVASEGLELLYGGNLEGARKVRGEVEEALTYLPRTEEGLEALESFAQHPVVNPRLTQDIEAWAARKGGPEAGELAGMAAHPANLLAVPGVGRMAARGAAAGRDAARTAAAIPGRALRSSAERAALKALGAPGTSLGELALRRGEPGLQELGRTVLDIPGAKLRAGPRGIRGPLRTAMEPVGQEISRLAQAASQLGGPAFDLGAVLARFDAATQPLMKDQFAASRIQHVKDYIVNTAKARGQWSNKRRQLMRLPADEAHALRQGLDDVIYDASTGLRKKSPIVQEFNRLRRLVDDELQQAVTTSLGPEAGHQWARANRNYYNLKDVQRLANAGFKRQVARDYTPQGSQRVRVVGMRVPGMSVQGSAPGFRMSAAHARGADLLARPFTF